MVKFTFPVKQCIGELGYDLFKLYMKISGKKPQVVNETETVQYIVKHRSSVTRFGDGEFLWAFQERKNDNFEKNSPELANRLLEVLYDVGNNSNLITCIPNIFDNLNGIKPAAKVFWEGFLIKKGLKVVNLLKQNEVYYDSKFTRPYIDFLPQGRNFNRKFENIRKIWNGRNVLIVEGEKTRFGVNSDLLENAQSVKRIVCPNQDAFEKYRLILTETVQKSSEIEDVLVLAALGPAATVLAFDLANDNIQTVDIGHLDIEYQWYNMHAQEKVPVPGKFVNEVESNFIKDLPNQALKEYKSQVISTIV